MISPSFIRCARIAAAALLSTLVCGCGCGALRTTSTPPPAFYALDNARVEARAAPHTAGTLAMAAPTLIINPPHAASGFDSQHIIYVRDAYKLEYFAHSEWVDTPARMLAPLIVAAVDNGEAFRAVVLMPNAAAGDLRLDTEIMRLQQDFSSRPSSVRFTLRAYMVDNLTRRVLAWREFDASVAAASDNPYGGVVAANRAVQVVLQQLADFCAETAGKWQPAAEARKGNEASAPGR